MTIRDIPINFNEKLKEEIITEVDIEKEELKLLFKLAKKYNFSLNKEI